MMSKQGLRHGGLKARTAQLAGRIAAAVLALAMLPALAYTQTSGGYNTPVGFTEISREVYGLHMAIFWICTVIGVLVFGVMVWSIIFHRRSKHPKPADFHESTTVEIIWTAVPFVILIAIAVPAAATLIKMEDTRNADMTVKVTGYQWKWAYEYLGEDVTFYSSLDAESNRARQLGSGIDPGSVPNYLVEVDNPLVLPVGKKVRFLITSNDVIHAWWVPEIAVKKDAIPGYINEVWAKIEEPGVYRGVCAELCGRDHGYMPIVVRAVPEAEYAQWLAQQKGQEVAAVAPATATDLPADAPPAEGAAPPAVETEAAAEEVAAAAPAAGGELAHDALLAQGEAVYKANCMACHQGNGTGLPPNFPSLIGSTIIKGDPAIQIAQVIKGKNLMPPFAQLSDAEIAAVVSYTRNSWGNSAGFVQPAQVAAQR